MRARKLYPLLVLALSTASALRAQNEVLTLPVADWTARLHRAEDLLRSGKWSKGRAEAEALIELMQRLPAEGQGFAEIVGHAVALRALGAAGLKEMPAAAWDADAAKAIGFDWETLDLSAYGEAGKRLRAELNSLAIELAGVRSVGGNISAPEFRTRKDVEPAVPGRPIAEALRQLATPSGSKSLTGSVAMAIRSEELNRLATGSKCTTSWDAMQGNDRRRFCAECRRDVLDFERLTPKEIRAHLEASQGKLCARLTHIGGRLSVFEPIEPFEPMRPSAPRRTSSLAAAVVTAWLGVGAAHAAPVEPAAPVAATPRDEALPGAARERATKSETRSTVGATIRGKVTQENGQPLPDVEVVAHNVLDERETLTVTRADGSYSIESLPTAVYYLWAQVAGFDIELQNNLMLEPGKVRQIDLIATPFVPAVSLGILQRAPGSPRQQFDDSDLVLVAVVGPSVVVERQDTRGLVKVATELRVKSLLKGKAPAPGVTYLHSEYPWAGRDNKPPPGFAPGTTILAYLDASAGSAGRTGEPAFESSDAFAGIERLGPAELAAYVERLKALSDLERTAERRGQIDAAELMEWLVASAENPPARGIAIAEIQSAHETMQKFAATQGTTPEIAAQDLRAAVKGFREEGGTVQRSDRPLLLGASLTDGQKSRLTAALQETERLRTIDLNLFEIVRKWDEKSAVTWLAHQLRTVEPQPADDESVTWQLYDLAEKLDDGALRALVEAARDRDRGIYKIFGNDCSKADAKLREEKLAASRKDLRHQFGKAVARRHGVSAGS